MIGAVPPMFWFVFWVGLAVGVLGFGFFMAILIHRGNMKALEALKAYAEKGIEPPPAIVEMLTRQLGETEARQAARETGTKAGNLIGLIAAASIGGGIAWWRQGTGGPQWVVWFFAGSALFFGVRAILYLCTAFTASER